MAKSENLYDGFPPRKYLEYFYGEPTKDNNFHISDDEVAILRFLTARLEGKHFRIALEAGSGPTIHNAVPVIDHVDQMHLSDYIPDSLKETKKWLENDPEAFNWDSYIIASLLIEGKNPEFLQQRSDALRRKITRLLPFDLSQPFPLGYKTQYPLVTSFYCVECATYSIDTWRTYMNNLLTLVEPGGTLLLATVKGASQYAVEEQVFPATPVREQDMESIFTQRSDFANVIIQTASFKGWEAEGFTEVILTSAEKTM